MLIKSKLNSYYYGVFTFFKNKNTIGKENQLINKAIDLSNFRFVSSKHSKFENGIKTGSVENCWRGIQINKNSSNDNSYSVLISRLDEEKKWKDDAIQMVIKQMKITAVSDNRLELCGYGDDTMGVSFSDYGITVLLENNSIVEIILKYVYRNTELHYYR